MLSYLRLGSLQGPQIFSLEEKNVFKETEQFATACIRVVTVGWKRRSTLAASPTASATRRQFALAPAHSQEQYPILRTVRQARGEWRHFPLASVLSCSVIVIGQVASMSSNVIWASTAALEAAVLFRGWKAGLFRKYPFFYAFVSWVLLTEGMRFWIYKYIPNFYQAFFWDTRLVTIAASYAVCVEIFKSSLRHNRGVARVAQKLLRVVFVIAAGYAASDFLHAGAHSVARAAADLGSYLSYIEAALLVVMLWLFTRYKIPFKRNLLGLVAGYSLWVGIEVIILIFLFLPGNGASVGLRKLAPLVYLTSMVIWSVSLWQSEPEPTQPPESAVEQDYQVLVAKTRASFAHLSARVGRTLRP